MHYTIFGSTGRIGSYLKKKLISDGNSVFSPSRKDYYLAHKNLGHVIYCSGVTSDFRYRSFDIIESHVSLLSFSSFKPKNIQFILLLSKSIVSTFDLSGIFIDFGNTNSP